MKKRSLVFITFFSLLLLMTLAKPIWGQTDRITVEIFMTVPESTPKDADIFLAGNSNAVGSWRPDGVLMERLEDGRYYLKLELPKGSTLEYKFTRGSWETVEKGQNGAEIANRRLSLDENKTVNATVISWREGEGGKAQSFLTGDFKYHEDFGSKVLENARDIIVYLPPGYEEEKNVKTRYPVLYMHDGQNLFDTATGFGGQEWQMDETAEKLIRQDRIEPIIIVGIYNTGARMTEYTTGRNPQPQGRNGEEYSRFVIEELKPFIDKTYRTLTDRQHTAVAGSSLGGLISLYMALTHPDTFGMSGVISASLFWNNQQPIKDVAQHGAKLKEVRIWVDMGANEGRIPSGQTVGSSVLNARLLIDEFHKAGLVPGKNYFYLEVPGGQHNERSWAQRMDKMLLYFFSK